MTKRRKVQQTKSLDERMIALAAKLKGEASALLAGAERDALLRKAKLADTCAHITDWLTSPGLQSPK